MDQYSVLIYFYNLIHCVPAKFYPNPTVRRGVTIENDFLTYSGRCYFSLVFYMEFYTGFKLPVLCKYHVTEYLFNFIVLVDMFYIAVI